MEDYIPENRPEHRPVHFLRAVDDIEEDRLKVLRRSGITSRLIHLIHMEPNKETSAEKPAGATATADACADKSCATGGCGGPGLCPGVALLLAYVLGGGIALLTGLNWLGWAVGIPTGLVLITGAWRFLPKFGKGQAS